MRGDDVVDDCLFIGSDFRVEGSRRCEMLGHQYLVLGGGQREVEALVGWLIDSLGDVFSEGCFGPQHRLVLPLALRNRQVFLVANRVFVRGSTWVAQLGPLIFDFHFNSIKY